MAPERLFMMMSTTMHAIRGVAVCSAQPCLMEFMCVGDSGHTLSRSAHFFDQSMHVAMCSAQPCSMEFVCGWHWAHSIKVGPFLRPKHARGNVLCSAMFDGICVRVALGTLYQGRPRCSTPLSRLDGQQACGNVLCSATLDGICVWVTLRTFYSGPPTS